MTNIYEELETMCLRCECRSDLKCGTVFHCKTYNNIHLEKLITENAELKKKTQDWLRPSKC